MDSPALDAAAPPAKPAVVVVAQYFHPEPIGSAPFVTDIVDALAGEIGPVLVLTNRPHYPNPAAFPDYGRGVYSREKRGRASVRRVGVWPLGAGAVRRLLRDVGYCLRHGLGGALKGTNGARVLVFVPGTLSLLLAYAIARRRREKIVAVVHDVESGVAGSLGLVRRKLVVRLLKAIERYALNKAGRIVVLTEPMRARLEANAIRRPIEVIPIWAAIEPSAEAEPRARGGAPVVTYSGNLGKKQGVDQLVGLARRLMEDAPHARILIRGDGSERGWLEKKFAELGARNVEMRGLVPREALAAALKEADIHLVPQAADVADYVMPSKIVSILAAGRPFVAVAAAGSAVHRIAEASGAGLTVPAGDGKALAAAVAELIGAPERRNEMGRRGARYACEEMSRTRIIGRYVDLLRT